MDACRKLRKAIRASDVQRVKSLLQSNSVNVRAVNNRNLLCLALTKNNTEVIELLIRAGADVNFIDRLYGTEGSVIHKLIIKANKALHQDRNKEVRDEYTRLALLAIDHGADINALNDDGESVLEFAVGRNSIEVMRELSKRGARMDLDSFSCCACSAIMRLAISVDEAVEALSLIMDLNDPSAQVRSERALEAATFTILSVYHNSDVFSDVFHELLKMIVDLNQHVSNGDTLLHIAACFGKVVPATVLLNRGVDVKKKTTFGKLPLFTAAKLDNTAVTELLISRGASIHDRNDDGQYPIHGACSSETVDNLLYLLKHGASVNVKDNRGRYPIHIAASNDCLQILLFLLSSGSPINVTDDEGDSPFLSSSHPMNASICRIAFIMQCAFVQTTGSVNDKHLKIVQADPLMSKVYRECCDDLQYMQQTVVFEDKTLLSLLRKNTSQLSAYYNNVEFVEAIFKCTSENRANFHWYIIPLMVALRIAKKKFVIIKNMKNILVESFPFPIPYLAIEKITNYTVYGDLVRSEFDEYLSFYEENKKILPPSASINALKKVVQDLNFSFKM